MEPRIGWIRPIAVFDQPFLASRALAAGAVTPAQLRGPRFRRLFAGIYVLADVEVDLALRSRAAALAVDGVLGGWSAAEVLGASCGPADARVEIVAPGCAAAPASWCAVMCWRPTR